MVFGLVRLQTLFCGKARLGKARRGGARRGSAWQGKARIFLAWMWST